MPDMTTAAQLPASVGTTGTPSPPTEAKRWILSGIVKPTMGEIVILNIKECSAFTGGIPKCDWTELEKPTNEYVSPNQLRASNAYSSQKSYNYRKKGMEGAEEKFKIGEDLEVFERKVTTQFNESGMDTITYLPDPEHVQKMTSYDIENNKAATLYVLDSYAGQNVSDLAEAFKIAAKELTLAGQYDHTYTLKMLKAFLAAGDE
eukprot:scaffold99254_cov67-Attheya_sp.AAC.1